MNLLRLFALTAALAAAAPLLALADARPSGLPPQAVMVSPCVATMGEHWANPHDLPFGPIYGVYDGKVVFTEVMVDQKSFAAGRAWQNVLHPPAGQHIDHVDIGFNPHGHEGYPVPHYDIHAYFVPHAVHESYCPHGIPDPEVLK